MVAEVIMVWKYFLYAKLCSMVGTTVQSYTLSLFSLHGQIDRTNAWIPSNFREESDLHV